MPVCSSNISHGFCSDHSYVTLTLQGNPLSHGRGYWKFNNTHLSSEEFTQEVRTIICDILSSSYDSFSGVWDTIKFRIKDYAIYFGKKTKKCKMVEKKLLTEMIENIRKEGNFINNPTATEELLQLEARLDNIIKEEMDGVIVRSKAQFVEKGERCTKYFFGLERNNRKRKMLNKLVNEESGESLLTQDKISEHAVSFYQKLYSMADQNRSTTDSYLTECPLNKIPEMLSSALDEPINLDEMDAVVGKLKNNKSPGWDGLTAEFYKHFWDDLKLILFHSYLESINNQHLSPSQRIGVITLLPKPKPPPDLVYLKNWRPITLLNVDYKIFTHTIKNRFINAIPTVISRVQSGFQSGKSTSDNLILMCLVLDHFNNNSDMEEGLLVQVDFEKAFDSVDHTFLFKTLEKMGFGPYLTLLVKIAFQGCMSYLNINSHLSAPVYLGRGLHQGSPLSPILFLLIAQVFSSKLEHNSNIRGIKINGINILLSLFADDTDIFLEATGSSVDEVMKEIRNFGLVSGCKSNMDKTLCIPLGAAKHNTNLLSHIRNFYGETFIDSSFTALGIDFDNSSSLQEISDLNFSNKLNKAKSRAKFWKSRDLTLFGRVTIIKSILMAQFVYIATAMPRPSNKIVDELTKFIFNFLWGVKCDKIKRDIITQEREAGGLSMFYPSDFLQSLKLKLLHKIGDVTFNHNWKDILINQLDHPEHPGICFENCLAPKTHSFTYDLINCYVEWKNTSANVNENCINHCVWGNRLVTDIGSRLWVPKLINYNINYLSDFVNSEGEVMSYKEFCVKTLAHSWHVISKREYVDLKMAIRRFNCINIYQKNVKNINPSLSLKFFTDPDKLSGKKIRDLCQKKVDFDNFLPLKKWEQDLGVDSMGWEKVFAAMYSGYTRNFKIIQFQYKLIMRISTCRYMRNKMKIDTDSPNCIYCTSELETLPHIFIDCPKTNSLVSLLESCLKNSVVKDYHDPYKLYYITCCHENQVVNYVWAAFKLYISRSFQTKNEPSWNGFKNHTRSLLIGESETIVSSIILALGL